MKELRKSSQFKKDFKRFSKELAKVEKLFAITGCHRGKVTSQGRIRL